MGELCVSSKKEFRLGEFFFSESQDIKSIPTDLDNELRKLFVTWQKLYVPEKSFENNRKDSKLFMNIAIVKFIL